MIVQATPAGVAAATADDVLSTERLLLEPVTLAMVEAVIAGDRAGLERLVCARVPEAWPGAELIHRGFGAVLEAVRADPTRRLWGDRLMVSRDGERRLIGSVVFHGRPGEDGIAEVGYGVEVALQGRGYATEATRAAVQWALAQPGVRAVRATTFPFHRASLRVIEKLGMKLCETELDSLWGERLVYVIERGERGERA